MGWKNETGKLRILSRCALLSWVILLIYCVQSHRKNHVEGTSELSTGDMKEGCIYPLVSTPPRARVHPEGVNFFILQVHTCTRVAEQSTSVAPWNGTEKPRGRMQLSKVKSGIPALRLHLWLSQHSSEQKGKWEEVRPKTWKIQRNSP